MFFGNRNTPKNIQLDRISYYVYGSLNGAKRTFSQGGIITAKTNTPPAPPELDQAIDVTQTRA